MNEKQFLECCDIQVKKHLEDHEDIKKLEISNGKRITSSEVTESIKIEYVIRINEQIEIFLLLKCYPDNVRVIFNLNGVDTYTILKFIDIMKHIENIPFGNFKECLNLLKRDNQGSNFKPRE